LKVPVQLEVQPPDRPKWWQSLQRIYQLVAKAINGNIEFGSPTAGPLNINGVWASLTTPGVANTDFTVTHNLGRTAVAYLVTTANAAVDVYTSPTANGSPTTQIILRASAATVAITMFLF
jgi:flavoprotein